MNEALVKAMKEWLFDRYQGFNNDDDHSWKFAKLIKEYEKEHGPLPMTGWRSKKQFRGRKDWWKTDFPE